MMEEEWLKCNNLEAMLYELRLKEFDSSRVPVYISTFAENGRVRKLLTPEMQRAFDDYVRWVQEDGPNPATLYPQFTEFDPLEKQIIDAWAVNHELRHLIGRPLSSWAWWDAGSFVMTEAYSKPVVGQWHRQPTPDTAELLRASANRLRDVVGNPFRPVTFSPEWRTETTIALARQMYTSRDFSAMPILADALQDAGCDNSDVLNHCRDTGATHVRGCWVVDMVLRKS
ncbi:hypothetical protein VT84_27835 [Gemmata sp. SH-PL17]|uniref:hypothetical protein n=1 Tax=Gemmata sp. SH-PL17 TaxID=1630693 RepID=UPI00078C45BE|nr:hypothetical protein [Gemmata sp. SH-PL17]AMV28246.1 hypothetical protein VT84_27835 [Gemmata sp. SH-PL17]